MRPLTRTFAPFIHGFGAAVAAADAALRPRTLAFVLAPRAVDCLFTFACCWLFLPYFQFYDYLDHDAQGIIAQARMSGDFNGWPNGYALLVMLTGAINQGFNLGGIAFNDYLLAYRAAIYLSSVGLLAATYAGLVLLTGRRGLAFALGIVVATLPGYTMLSMIGEDNLFSSMVHTQFAVVFLATALAWSRGSRLAPRRELLLRILPFSLLLTVLSHPSLNVAWAAPAMLPWIAGRRLDRAWLRRIGAVYGLCFSLFALAYVYFTVRWMGRLDFEAYRQCVKSWFFPAKFYHAFYFWNLYGWSLRPQFAAILNGLRGLIAFFPIWGFAAGWLYGGLLLLLAMPSLTRRARRRRLWVGLALLTALHIPHSAIFNSYNIERWDVIVPLAAMLCGALSLQLLRRVRFIAAPVVPVALAGVLAGIFAFNWNARADVLEKVGAQMAWPATRERIESLRRRADPDRSGAGPSVCMITKEEYDRNPLLPTTYFAWESELFILYPNGQIDQPGSLFPQATNYRIVPLGTLERAAAALPVFSTPQAGKRFAAFERGEFAPYAYSGRSVAEHGIFGMSAREFFNDERQ